MHLAYLDETGTDGHSPVVMVGALIVPVGRFGHLSQLYSTAIQQILPVDKMAEFGEFHASDLYLGNGAFAGIDEKKRFTAIQVLLAAVQMDKLPFVYAAADRKKFESSPFGSGKPLLSAFHMCLLGIEDWALANHPDQFSDGRRLIDWKDTYLCIQDDCDDKQLKVQFRKAYRALRAKDPFVPPHQNRLWHAHDDMFFADSKDCLGVQMADLCNYFVRHRIVGSPDPQNFYQMFSGQVICAKPKPEWEQFHELFRTHESV